MLSSVKHVTQKNQFRFFNKVSIQPPKILYVSVESLQRKTGLYDNPTLARQLASRLPTAKPIALARLMRNDMFKYIEKAMAWKEKMYPNERNLLTIITTPEGMFNTPPDEELMLNQQIFQEELLLPLQEYMKQLQPTVGIHFGTFGVLVDPNDKNFVPSKYLELAINRPSFTNQAHSEILNKPPNVSGRFMNAAIHGTGGSTAVVDYYTKQNVWHGDNYKDLYLQVYDTTKPYVVIQELEGNKLARVLRICLDAAYSLTENQISELLIQIGAHTLPQWGITEIVSYKGSLPLPGNVIYDMAFVADGYASTNSGAYNMKKNVLMQTRKESEIREHIPIEAGEWLVDAQLYPYRPVKLGEKMILQPEVGILEKLSNFLSPRK